MVKRRFLCSLLCFPPLLCGFGARGSEYQIRGSECDVRHVRSQDSSDSLREISDSLFRMLVSRWGFFRKPTSFSFSLNEGFFLKSPRPSLPLKRAPPLSPSPFPLRGQGMCQPPYSVLKPLRYKVGGPSEVSPAAKLHFAVCDRKDMRERRSCESPEAHSSTP